MIITAREGEQNAVGYAELYAGFRKLIACVDQLHHEQILARCDHLDGARKYLLHVDLFRWIHREALEPHPSIFPEIAK
jgi:hypothetical protein